VQRLQVPGGEQSVKVFPLLNRRNGNRNGNRRSSGKGWSSYVRALYYVAGVDLETRSTRPAPLRVIYELVGGATVAAALCGGVRVHAAALTSSRRSWPQPHVQTRLALPPMNRTPW
jgi:hypothetical protein